MSNKHETQAFRSYSHYRWPTQDPLRNQGSYSANPIQIETQQPQASPRHQGSPDPREPPLFSFLIVFFLFSRELRSFGTVLFSCIYSCRFTYGRALALPFLCESRYLFTAPFYVNSRALGALSCFLFTFYVSSQ